MREIIRTLAGDLPCLGDDQKSEQCHYIDCTGWWCIYFEVEKIMNQIEKHVASAAPVPAVVGLFGTALIGLVGFSKRSKGV